MKDHTAYQVSSIQYQMFICVHQRPKKEISIPITRKTHLEPSGDCSIRDPLIRDNKLLYQIVFARTIVFKALNPTKFVKSA